MFLNHIVYARKILSDIIIYDVFIYTGRITFLEKCLMCYKICKYFPNKVIQILFKCCSISLIPKEKVDTKEEVSEQETGFKGNLAVSGRSHVPEPLHLVR